MQRLAVQHSIGCSIAALAPRTTERSQRGEQVEAAEGQQGGRCSQLGCALHFATKLVPDAADGDVGYDAGVQDSPSM